MATKSKEVATPNIKDLNILQRIHGIMGEVGNLAKTKEIKGRDGKVMYKVVESEKLDAALKPLLMKWRVMLDSSVIDIDERAVTTKGKYGDKTENYTSIILEVKWRNIDDKDDFISGKWPGLGIDNGDKSGGKALTYAFRNCRTKVLGISTGDPEPEADDSNGHPEANLKTNLTVKVKPVQQDTGQGEWGEPPLNEPPQDSPPTLAALPYMNEPPQDDIPISGGGVDSPPITDEQRRAFVKQVQTLGVPIETVKTLLAEHGYKTSAEIPKNRYAYFKSRVADIHSRSKQNG